MARHYPSVKRVPDPRQIGLDFDRLAPVETKTCTRCGHVKGLDCFNKSRGNQCKACGSAYDKARYKLNAVEICVRNRAHYNSNLEKERSRTATYRESHRDEINSRHRTHYRQSHDRQAVRAKSYYDQNREIILDRQQSYRVGNRENINARQRSYYKVVRATLTYQTRVLVNRTNRRTAGVASPLDIHYVKSHWDNKCAYCGHGCLGKHQHLEHIVPIVSGGTNVLNNLTIACSACNFSKHAKEVFTWWKSSGNWDPTREAKLRAHMTLAIEHTDKDEFGA